MASAQTSDGASLRRASGVSWNRCDSAGGPAKWGGVCQTGDKQTPINLCGAVPLPGGAGLTLSGYDTEVEYGFVEDGELKLKAPAGSAITANIGDISKQVGRDTSTSGTNPTWQLEQLHFHWGRSGTTGEGSEHYLEGIQYEAEAHFVHYNTKYKSVTDAVTSGNSDALMVIGQFMKLDTKATENNVGKAIGDLIGAIRREESPKAAASKSIKVKLGDMINRNKGFYTYAGGLTTPTCNTVVTWVVMAEPIAMSQATLDKMIGIKNSVDKTFGPHGNYRPLQPLNGRTVYFSGSVSSFPCPTRGVVEPKWTCSSASSLASGTAMAFVAAVMSLVAVRW